MARTATGTAMTLPEGREYWGRFSIGLHWLTFIVVLSVAAVGLFMEGMETGKTRVTVFALHKSLGLTVLGLTALRLLWRFSEGRLPPVPGTPRWQHRAASLTHFGLYALLLLVPLSGWWLNSAAGHPLRWFGLFALPALGEFDRRVKLQAEQVHEFLFWVLAATVAVHALAAFWHHYQVRDRTLARMLPWAEKDLT